MKGTFARITPDTLERGARLLGYRSLAPAEVETMFVIDDALLNPGAE